MVARFVSNERQNRTMSHIEIKRDKHGSRAQGRRDFLDEVGKSLEVSTAYLVLSGTP